MRQGCRVGVTPPLRELQARCQASVRRLPSGVRALKNPHPYDVRVSESLKALAAARVD